MCTCIVASSSRRFGVHLLKMTTPLRSPLARCVDPEKRMHVMVAARGWTPDQHTPRWDVPGCLAHGMERWSMVRFGGGTFVLGEEAEPAEEFGVVDPAEGEWQRVYRRKQMLLDPFVGIL